MSSGKYFIEGFLNGFCAASQESHYCKTFLEWIILIIQFRRKYPIVNAQIRSDYKTCNRCVYGKEILCYKPLK